MKCALVVASALLAISSTASAGVYVGLGVGTEPAANDELATVATPSGRSVRGLLGFRFANVSVEGAINGFDVLTGLGNHTVYQASAAAKLSLPLGNGFEAFGRGGLEHTQLDLGDDRYNLAGNGWLLGAGFEYRFNTPLISGSIFVDYNVHRASLDDERKNELDATTRMWGLGVTVGL